MKNNKKKISKKNKLKIILGTIIFFSTLFQEKEIHNNFYFFSLIRWIITMGALIGYIIIELRKSQSKLKKEDALFSLNLFNEKTDRLINSGYIKHIQANKGLNVSIKVSNNDPFIVTHNLPQQDIIDAFVLTIRFFIQDNECSSLNNLSNLYNQFPLSKKTIKDFKTARNKLNSEFEKKTSFHLNFRNKATHLTHRDVFDTFIYGGLAHARRKKKIEFDRWMNTKGLASFIEVEFNN